MNITQPDALTIWLRSRLLVAAISVCWTMTALGCGAESSEPPSTAPLVVTATSALTSTVTYTFVGVLDDPFGTLPARTPFTGSLDYTAKQTDLSPANPNRGDYLYQRISITFGATTVTDSGTGVINVYDSASYPTDLFHLYTYNASGSLGGLPLTPGAGIQLVLQDITGAAWSSTELPGAGLTMANLTPGNATFIELRSDSHRFPGSMTIARGHLQYLIGDTF